ncbi:MAG: FAD-binding oxidoreductase [Devosiaceae bacterium]|nr:FAD-binding oxidoreductase [Devosiaceae bacterium]
MALSQKELLNSLSLITGLERIIVDEGEMRPFVEEPRKRFFTKALGVVFPKSVTALQSLMSWANDNQTPLIPQGGNTGMVGGQVPLLGNEIIVSLSKINQLRNLDSDAGYMCVEAGMVLQTAQGIAQENNMIFPLSIASEGSAQIGGILSTNAGGVQVLAYGNARQLCMGVEAVLPDGSLYQGLNSLKKNNTGYDISNLLVGAEGTLGFITAATLKLFPRPLSFETAWINVPSPNIALQLFFDLRDSLGSSLTAFELMPRFGVDIQLKHQMIDRDPSPSASPWYVLAEVSIAKNAPTGVLSKSLEAAFETGLIEDANIASSLQERQNMWATREQMSESQSREGASIKHDISVPVSLVPELIRRGNVAAKKIIPGIRPCPFGHLGDGNIHFNFSQPVDVDPKAFMADAPEIHDAIYGIVAQLGGSISAEHGIGQLKVDLLAKVKDPVALSSMRAIKEALDPNNICNPGKVLK